MEPTPADPRAARALLAFWRSAGVDMEEAEAIYARTAGVSQSGLTVELGNTSSKPPIRAPVARKVAAPDASVENARALAAAAGSISELRNAVENFSGCALKATARTTVFADGVENAQVLLIGEAPGKEEDEQAKPFVGRSGQLLDRMLAAIGLDRKQNLLISNTIYWRPPGNRDPTQGEIVACLPFVERLIQLSAPKLLILTGKAAAQTVLRREEAISRMRGRRLQYAPQGIKAPVNVMVMLHPAYLLRRPNEKRLAWGDLLLAEAWLDELGVARASHP